MGKSSELKQDALALGLALKKLELSGLDQSDMTQLGMEAWSAEQCNAKHESFKSVPGLFIPYFDLGGQPLTWHPHHDQFFRLRYLESTKKGFDKQTTEKERRYTQLPGEGPCAYFPRNIDWPDIAEETSVPIYLTEGELKAACGSKNGYPTIGLGGVYNFRSTRLGSFFLPELEAIKWLKRRVYIVYDSDFRTNQMVCKAINTLAEELEARGAYTHVVTLPDLAEDGKTGFDDFLVSQPEGEFDDLVRQAEQLTLVKPLFWLNEKVVYVADANLIYELKTGTKMSPDTFKNAAYVKTQFAERDFKADGTVSMKKVSAAMTWMKWPLRREAPTLTYKPGQGQFLKDGSVNMWRGWGVEPKAGDVSMFLEVFNHVMTGAEPEAKEWLLRWFAFPLKYPGVKMFTSAVLHGIKHGTGKSLLGYIMGRIYGKNFTEINQGHLHNLSNFNAWAEARQFVLGDDVTGSNKRADADMLKKLITQKELRINTKFVPEYTVPDCINYLFTSNHPDAFYLEDDDRRFFIHEVTVDPLPEEFYLELDLWLDSGGASAIFYHLLNLDLGDFNPAARAYATAAKHRMVHDNKSDLGSWVHRLSTTPDDLLMVGEAKLPGDLFTNKQLLAVYDPTSKTGTTSNGLGRELKRAGIRHVLDGRPTRTLDGVDRVYAIRNRDKWLKPTVTPQQIFEHLQETTNTLFRGMK